MRTRNIFKAASVSLLLIALQLSVACRGNGASPDVSYVPDAHEGFANVWVGYRGGYPIMIQVTRDGNALSGTLYTVPTRGGPIHTAFTGTIDGSALTLSFVEGSGFPTAVSGNVTDDSMVLQVPSDDGQIQSVTLKPGSMNEYIDLLRESVAAGKAFDVGECLDSYPSATSSQTFNDRPKVVNCSDPAALSKIIAVFEDQTLDNAETSCPDEWEAAVSIKANSVSAHDLLLCLIEV